MLLEKIRKHYPVGGGAGVLALDEIDIEFKRGESVALMGSSGSGKSTLMNVLGCLDQPTSGRYFLNGVEVNQMSKKELAILRNQQIGFVFQNFHLLPRTTALENVEMPMLYHPKRSGVGVLRKQAMDALQRVGLANRSNHAPNELSGGQQQRVAIARALVNGPRILLADEPTGNLDTVTTLEAMHLFQNLIKEGLTVILVTHEPELCTFLDRRIELQDGRVIQDTKNQKPACALRAKQEFLARNPVVAEREA